MKAVLGKGVSFTGTNPIKELGDGGRSLINGIERTGGERVIRRLFVLFFNVQENNGKSG